MNILGCMFMIHSLHLKLEKKFNFLKNNFQKLEILKALPQSLQLYGFSQFCALGLMIFFFYKVFLQLLH